MPGDVNYFFYFPIQNEVLSFVDPNVLRIWPKGVLDGKYTIAVEFRYKGGFPPGFASVGRDMITGTITYPIPGDKFTRVVVSEWPFIRRSVVQFDIPKYCSFNKKCFCIRS